MDDRTQLQPDQPDATILQSPDQPDGTILQSPTDVAATFAQIDPDDHRLPPNLPAGYELLRELGRGGMGVVYHARQAQLNRTVALKMLLCGDHCSLADLARFVAEGEAVARVRHPNVVQVYDAGRLQGIPYVAMEYVGGGPLSARLKDGPLMPAAAAHLLEQVARGVAACHAVGILHRDLKPANILLSRVHGQPSTADLTLPLATDEGTVVWEEESGPIPKVADFGLAKRVGSANGPTATSAVMGTPSYMAPEQARGDSKNVGPAADVYALGSVLYELLTGRPPFQGPDALDVLRRVSEDEPLPVRTLQPTVPRDLETVCMKCLEKEPGKRYASADALGDDLRRWRTGEAISARPAGLGEVAARWARRNRPLTLSAFAVFSALLLGLAVAVREATRADFNRDQAVRAAAAAEAARVRAEADRATAEAVSEFLTDLLKQSSPRGQVEAGRTARPDLTVGEALEYASRNLDARFPNRPDLEAAVRLTVGRAYTDRGDHAAARPHLEKAEAVVRREKGDRHPDTLAAGFYLARMHFLAGRRPEAEALLTAVLAGRRAELGDRHPDTLGTLILLGSVYVDMDQPPKAEPLLREALTALRELAPGSADQFAAAATLGVAYSQANRPDEAEPLLREALAGQRERGGSVHPNTLQQAVGLAVLYMTRREFDRAVPLLDEAARGFRATHGEAHPDTLIAEAYLGTAYTERKDWAAADAHLPAAYRGLMKQHGPKHPDVLMVGGNLSMLYVNSGRVESAVPVLEDQWRGFRDFGDGFNSAIKRTQLGRMLVRLGKPAEAEPHLTEGYKELMRLRPDRPGRDWTYAVRQTAACLVWLYADRGDPKTASERWAEVRADVPGLREPAPKPRRVER